MLLLSDTLLHRTAFVCSLVAACSSSPPGPADSNPLGSTKNILPFPSSLYERSDAASPTGIRLDVPPGALPVPGTGTAFDTTPIDARTGWPSTVTILWAAPGGVDPSTLVGYDDYAASIAPGSSTVLYDMTAGALVAHFTEVDANEQADFDHQAVYIRPAQRLAGGHRYAVGITKAVTSRAGKPLPVTPGFAAVLANTKTGHARLDAAMPRLREAVAALESAGVPRAQLLVAWDFTVADDATAMADPLAARDAALAAMGDRGANLTYTVTSDQGTINGDPRIARRIELDYTAPEVAAPGLAGFHRDDSGKVIAQGTMTAHAYIAVPPCATAQNPAGILIFGHGFFGNLDELRHDEYLRDISEDACLVIAGTVWVGMSSDDTANALYALNDLNLGWGFGQRIWQGIDNFIALEQLLRGKLATELLVDNANKSIVDPTRVYFWGISQGHILGSTFFAYDPFLTRGALHVGGANWSLMFERSMNWAVYGAPLKGAYATLLEADIMEQVLEMGLEPVDGALVAAAPVPGTPDKHILMHTSLGDAQVPNLASFFQARSLGLTLITPAVKVPFGFETQQAATSDRAYVIVDEHPSPLPPADNTTFGYDNQAHGNPRRRQLIQQMLRDFWATGTVTNTCTGACDCAAGNCGALKLPLYGGN
ncbi:MAG: hypothetical protein ACM31C_33895 [Acidobacteriota bacterium]